MDNEVLDQVSEVFDRGLPGFLGAVSWSRRLAKNLRSFRTLYNAVLVAMDPNQLPSETRLAQVAWLADILSARFERASEAAAILSQRLGDTYGYRPEGYTTTFKTRKEAWEYIRAHPIPGYNFQPDDEVIDET